MKRLTVFVSLVVGLFVAGGPSAAAAQQVTLLHVNDTHSHLASWGPKDANLDGTLGGLPRAAAIVAAEKQNDPNALFVHAGDFMSGDLFFNEYLGVPELQMLESLGLDALVLGNRDFEFTSDFLTGVLEAAWTSPGGVPILATNLDPQGHALGNWTTPTLMKEVNGVKVGLFGLTHPKGSLAKPAPVKILPYLDDKPGTVDIAPAAVNQMREAGAQVVICVTHLGMDLARQLAMVVPGIDVIVNAHDNAVLDQPEAVLRPRGGTTYIVSAGSYYRWVGRLRLLVNGEEVSLVDYALLSADEGQTPHPSVQATIDGLKEGIVERYGDVYHQPLGWAGRAIVGEPDRSKPKRDTALGNLLTDAYRAWTGTEIAIEATGFVGDPLPRGAIVGADVFRAMSYGLPALPIVRPWRLVTFRATGTALIGALETTLGIGGDYFPQLSGMRLQYDSRRAPGKRILLDSVRVGENRLVADALYSVTVTEGVYGALKGLGMPMQEVVKPDVLAFDAARNFVALQGELSPAASNRIRDIAVIPSNRTRR